VTNLQTDWRRWIGYIVGAIVVLLLLGWLLGPFANLKATEVGTVDATNDAEEAAATGDAADEVAD
jgi:hypothetical protein